MSSCLILSLIIFLFFFFNDTATTEIYTLSLHDALPISIALFGGALFGAITDLLVIRRFSKSPRMTSRDRKSTRLNSSHTVISYAVFCLKKKKKKETARQTTKIGQIEHIERDRQRCLHTK